jgi:ABC-type bacteriocin/lantibiotic exporter with double-glycine peptidase domain
MATQASVALGTPLARIPGMLALLLSSTLSLAGPSLAVPYVAQTKETCGAASLAMVLRYWGQAASQDEIAGELFEDELHGIRGSRLRDLAARRGLLAMAYAGDLAHVRAYVSKGRPLIVAWKVGRRQYHNVVVVGFDEERREILVNDPAEGPGRRVPEETFEKRWSGAGHWTLLVIPGAE